MPTNGCSTKPLKVKLLAGEQKATERKLCVSSELGSACCADLPPSLHGGGWTGSLMGPEFRFWNFPIGASLTRNRWVLLVIMVFSCPIYKGHQSNFQ